MLNKILDKDIGKIRKSSYIWNSMSSVAKAAQLSIFVALISRATNQGDAGIMSLAFSIAYMMRTIGDYSIRNFQVTDTSGKYKFADYFTSRIITLLIMVICSLVYVIPKAYGSEKTITILIICVYMGIDAMEDVIHGMFQQRDRLDIAAFTEFIRYFCGIVVFGGAIFFTRRLWAATLTLTIFSTVLCLFLNYPFMRTWDKVEISKDTCKVRGLLLEGFPLFLSAFLSAYINNAPKDAIDKVLDNEMQGYFGMIFMPVFVVNLLSTMVYRPITVELAQEYDQDVKKYVKNINKQYLIITGITALCILGTAMLGIPVLSLFYKVSLEQYWLSLVILIFGGGLSASISFSSILLTIQRKQNAMIIAYGIAAAVSVILSVYFVKNWNILGASLLYVLLNIVILITMCIIVAGDVISRLKTDKGGTS